MNFRIDKENEIGYITLPKGTDFSIKGMPSELDDSIKEIVLEYEFFDNYIDWDNFAYFVRRLKMYLWNYNIPLIIKGKELPKSIHSNIEFDVKEWKTKVEFEPTGPNELLNLDTDDYKVEDGILISVNDSLKNVVIPEGVLRIGDEIICFDKESIFKNCNVVSIALPTTLKELPAIIFQDKKLLKKVTMSDGLEIILASAFKGCSSLESVDVPKTVRTVYSKAFMNCESLKEVTLHDGLEELWSRVFGGCKNLESITIPKTLKSIPDETFKGCESLKNITLLAGLEKIGDFAFSECKSLEEIIIPSTVNTFSKGIFEKCSNLKYVIIRYKNYEELQELIKRNEVFFGSDEDKLLYKSAGICPLSYTDKHGWKNKAVNLIFEGPELSLSERLHINNLVKDNSAKILFKVNNNIEQTEKEEIERELEKEKEEHDDDIQKLLDEINKICSYLPDSIKNKITVKVNKLLEAYQNDLESIEPSYDNSENSLVSVNLSFGKDVNTIKPKLLADLEMIILNLSTADNLIKFLEELNQYKGLLNTSVDSLSTDDTVKGNIQNIIYISSKLDEEKSKETLNKLSKYIDDTINNVSLEFNSLFDSHSLSNTIDYNQEFMLNISKLYDEVNSEYNSIRPIKALIDGLNEEAEYRDGDELIDIISSTKFVISKISNGTYKESLEEQLNQIIEKYTTILNNILNDKELLKKTDSKEIEKNIRKDLHPLLEQINNYATLDKYEIEKANKTNILTQLIESIDIVENETVKDLTEEDKLKPITSYVIEINNEILSNDLIDEDNKIRMKSDLLQRLSLKEEQLEEKNISSLNEYNQYTRDIIKDLLGIELRVDIYLRKVEEYNKNVK